MYATVQYNSMHAANHSAFKKISEQKVDDDEISLLKNRNKKAKALDSTISNLATSYYFCII